METLDEILNMWEKDSEIDSTEPGSELLKIPKLHSKYLKLLIKARALAKQTKDSFIEKRKEMFSYYSGHFNTDPNKLHQLGLQPFKLILKSDIQIYLESDPELLKLSKKEFYYNEIVKTCELIIAELKSRTYQLRDFISWEKFIQGA